MGILLFWALANFKAASWRKYYHQQGFFEILFHIVYEINNIIMSTEDKAKWNQHLPEDRNLIVLTSGEKILHFFSYTWQYCQNNFGISKEDFK